MQKETHNLQYAGIWRRWVAVMIDVLIFIVPKMLIALIFLTVFDWIGKDNIPYSVNYAAEICIFGLLVFVYAKFLSSGWQATPGKRFMKVYVVDKVSKQVSLKRAIIRAVLPSLIFLPLAILQPLGSDTNPYYVNSDVGNKYIPQFIETMPKITNELRTLKVEPANLSHNEIMAEISSNPNLQKIYIEEFSSLSDQKMKEMTEAGYNIQNFMLGIGEHIGMTFVTIICFLVFIMWHFPAFVTSKKLTMHDMIAGTRVLYGRA